MKLGPLLREKTWRFMRSASISYSWGSMSPTDMIHLWLRNRRNSRRRGMDSAAIGIGALPPSDGRFLARRVIGLSAEKSDTYRWSENSSTRGRSGPSRQEAAVRRWERADT